MILVIEECNRNRRGQIALLLAGKGLEASSVNSCEKALQKLGELSPELIIVDSELPEDNLGICYRLRREVGVPIIRLGTSPGGKAWVKSVEAGADFYLVRSFSLSELIAHSRALIRRYRINQASNDTAEVRL